MLIDQLNTGSPELSRDTAEHEMKHSKPPVSEPRSVGSGPFLISFWLFTSSTQARASLQPSECVCVCLWYSSKIVLRREKGGLKSFWDKLCLCNGKGKRGSGLSTRRNMHASNPHSSGAHYFQCSSFFLPARELRIQSTIHVFLTKPRFCKVK